MLQLAENHEKGLASTKPKRPSMKERKQKLLAFLQGMLVYHRIYEHVTYLGQYIHLSPAFHSIFQCGSIMDQ